MPKQWDRRRTLEMDRRDEAICKIYEATELSLAEIAERFDLTKGRVWQIVNERPHERGTSQVAEGT